MILIGWLTFSQFHSLSCQEPLVLRHGGMPRADDAAVVAGHPGVFPPPRMLYFDQGRPQAGKILRHAHAGRVAREVPVQVGALGQALDDPADRRGVAVENLLSRLGESRADCQQGLHGFGGHEQPRSLPILLVRIGAGHRETPRAVRLALQIAPTGGRGFRAPQQAVAFPSGK